MSARRRDDKAHGSKRTTDRGSMVDVRDRRHVNQACVDSAQQPLDLSRGFGTVIMRVWSGAPEAVTTVAATVAVLWLVETKRPYAWVGALAAMYAYSGLRNAMRTRRLQQLWSPLQELRT